MATPSMKAAAEAFGAKPSIFTQGFAAVTNEVDAVEAALASPGQVLKRPHGQGGRYKLEPDALVAPKMTAKQRAAAKEAEASRKRKRGCREASDPGGAAEGPKDAEAELAAIEQEEADLRSRREQIQKKFHLRSVK